MLVSLSKRPGHQAPILAKVRVFYHESKAISGSSEMQLADRNEPVNLRMLYVRADNGQLIQLDNL